MVRSCRCDRPINVVELGVTRCLKCGHDKAHLPPTRWRQILALAGLLLEPERKAA